MLAADAAVVIRPAFFVEMEMDTSPVTYLRVWTGMGTKSWNSKTWLGVADVGSISAFPETTSVQAQGLTLTLSGIPSALVSDALTYLRQGKAVSIWMAMLDDADAVTADPYKSFGGSIDMVSMDEGGKTSSITVNVENRLIDLKRPRERRYTHEDQQVSHPGDLGFQYVEQLPNQNLSWPGPATPFPVIPSYNDVG